MNPTVTNHYKSNLADLQSVLSGLTRYETDILIEDLMMVLMTQVPPADFRRALEYVSQTTRYRE